MRSARSAVLWGSLFVSTWCSVGSQATGTVRSDGGGGPGASTVEFSIRLEKGDGAVLPRRIRSTLPAVEAEKVPGLGFVLSPLEDRLFADAADGRWDTHSLLGAALVASGVGAPEKLQRYERQVAGLVDELARCGEVSGSVQEKARAVFEFMHRRVLVGGYQVDATDLTLALDEGRFNCVSASVLFSCLAEPFGLTVRGLEIPAHAMSRLILPDGTLDVETTCPEWFRLLGKPERQAELVRQTLGLQRVPGEENPREVSGVELVATIYYNRGVDLLGQKRFSEAVTANVKALRLDPSSVTARGNLLAGLNNWAIDLGSQARYAEAVDLLRQGLALDPGYATFKANLAHIHHQWVEELCRLGRFREAFEVTTAASRILPGETYFSQARLDVYRRWVQSASEAPPAPRTNRRNPPKGALQRSI